MVRSTRLCMCCGYGGGCAWETNGGCVGFVGFAGGYGGLRESTLRQLVQSCRAIHACGGTGGGSCGAPPGGWPQASPHLHAYAVTTVTGTDRYLRDHSNINAGETPLSEPPLSPGCPHEGRNTTPATIEATRGHSQGRWDSAFINCAPPPGLLPEGAAVLSVDTSDADCPVGTSSDPGASPACQAPATCSVRVQLQSVRRMHGVLVAHISG